MYTLKVIDEVRATTLRNYIDQQKVMGLEQIRHSTNKQNKNYNPRIST